MKQMKQNLITHKTENFEVCYDLDLKVITLNHFDKGLLLFFGETDFEELYKVMKKHFGDDEE